MSLNSAVITPKASININPSSYQTLELPEGESGFCHINDLSLNENQLNSCLEEYKEDRFYYSLVPYSDSDSGEEIDVVSSGYFNLKNNENEYFSNDVKIPEENIVSNQVIVEVL